MSIENSSETYPAGGVPVGYQAGQWLRYKVLDEKGRPSIATYKLLSVLEGGFALETVIESYFSRDVSYIEIQYELGAPVSSIDVTRVVTRTDDNEVEELGGTSLSIMKSTYKKLAGQLFLTQVTAAGGSTASVPAGNFQECSEMDSTISFGPWSFSSHSWHHPAVPMHGMVRSERSDGKPGSSELISFGMSGAKSEVL